MSIETDLNKATEYLKNNEAIAFQTETVYGLGAKIDSDEALQKIFALKGRAFGNPLITHVSNKEQIYKIAKNINKTAEILINQFFPGPLTLVLEKKKEVSNVLTAGLDTIAIRMPSHKIAIELIEKVGVPVAAASANKSGRPSPTHWKHVLEDFKDEIPCILYDSANESCDFGLESTVLLCTNEKKLIILRTGSTTKEEIESVLSLNDLSIIVIPNDESQKALCPGVTYKHYAPRAKVVLFSAPFSSDATETNRDTDSAVLYISEMEKEYLGNFNLHYKFNSNQEYAKHLYSVFRECDTKNIGEIYCEIPPNKDYGLALIDRLNKAMTQY